MRRLPLLIAAIVVVLLAVDTLAWRYAVGLVATQTMAWAEARRAEGWSVAMSPPQPEGWPFAARVRVQTVEISGAAQSIPGGVAFGADAAVIGVRFPSFRRLIVNLEQAQYVRIGVAPEQRFTTKRHEITMDLPSVGLPETADVAIDTLSAPQLTIGKIQGRVSFASPGAVLEALAIDLRPMPLSAIGKRIERVALDAQIAGPLWTTPTAWRDAGGAVAVRQFDIDWGKLQASGNANLRLDSALQPTGTADARLTGTAETLDALAEARLIAPRAATAAKAVLALLQRPQPNGKPAVQLPLTLQDRTLALGRIPLARLPELIW
jgi:hypothetical protein